MTTTAPLTFTQRAKFGKYAVSLGSDTFWYIQNGDHHSTPYDFKSDAVNTAINLARTDAQLNAKQHLATSHNATQPTSTPNQPASTPTQATFKRLSGGDWGLCLTYAKPTKPVVGDQVLVTKRNGNTTTETIGRVRWSSSNNLQHYVELGASTNNNQPQPSVSTTTSAATYAELQSLFDLTKSKLKIARMFLGLPNYTLRITKSTKSANLVFGLRTGTSGPWDYVASLRPDGTLRYDKHNTTTLNSELDELMIKLEADPLGYAAELGKLAGLCCFCAKQLTDQRSKDAGFGHRCAKIRGLVWGVNAKQGKCEIKQVLEQVEQLAQDVEVVGEWRAMEATPEDYYAS